MIKILKSIILISIAVSLVACDRITEDLPGESIDQMTVTGRILDFNNQPRKGVVVKAYYQYFHWDSLFPHSDLRLKASSTTDANGYYSLPIFRKKDEFNLDRKMQEETDRNGDYVAMVFLVEQDETKNFYNGFISRILDVNSFWDNRECRMEDYILYDTRTIRIIMNQMHPAADSKRLLYCSHKHGGAIISSENGPIDYSMSLPIGDDLLIERIWNEEYIDSLIFKYPDIPDIIDASYYP